MLFILFIVLINQINALQWCEETNKNASLTTTIIKCHLDNSISEENCIQNSFSVNSHRILFKNKT